MKRAASHMYLLNKELLGLEHDRAARLLEKLGALGCQANSQALFVWIGDGEGL